MKTTIKVLAGVLLMSCILFADLASAQFATVVASCPATRASPYTVGTQVLVAADTSGNLCGSSGGSSAVTQGTSPWADNVSQWAGTLLGAPTAYGVAPSGTVPGVNAYVTNTIAVTGTFWQATQPVSGTFWQATQPVSIASLPASASQYPAGATPVTISATGTTAATAATLAGTSGKTTYVCGFSITSDAVAALAGSATVAGVITGTMTFIQGVGAIPAVSSLTQTFSPCVPASTSNTGIVVTSAAAGTGGNTAVNAWGYQL